MKLKEIIISDFDSDRLLKLIQLYKSKRKLNDGILKLEKEISRAKIVSKYQIPNNIITLHSKVRFRIINTSEEKSYTIVFPHTADITKGKISILSPIAISLIGYSVGDIIEWEVPSGRIKIEVLDILYQPEASGDYSL